MKKNFIYSVIYQILLILLPFITVPYVSRILGSDGVGVYSYTYSIVYYFGLIAMLGINNYGNRTIAKVRDNKQELSKNFFEIYTIQIIMSLIMIIIYIIYMIIGNIQYRSIAFIQMIYLFSLLFDLNWFFFGLEKFKLTVMRNIFIKILSLVFIFIFVKQKNDLWIYTLIMGGSAFVSYVLLVPFLFKEVSRVKIKKEDIVHHIKPIIILFIPVIAVSLYKIMDKIMLGNMCVIDEVGYYEQAERIINIPLGVITALGTVMLPRISNLLSRGEDEQVFQLIKKSINFIMFMAFPICFGLISISSDFVPIFLGGSFTKSSILVYYLSPTILFISFANVLRTQYLIPRVKDKIYVISVIGGAVINLLINALMIPKYMSIGACIGTIAAEVFVMAYQTFALRKMLPIREYFSDIRKFFANTLVMFGAVMLLKLVYIPIILKVILQILFGIIIYVFLNFEYVNQLVDFKKILRRRK